MNPLEQPVEIRISATKEDFVVFLERLARDEDFRREFERYPRDVLASHGVEVTPPEAVPSRASVPDPVALEAAAARLRGEPEWPYIFWWWWPYIWLWGPPMEGGGAEST